MRSNSRFQVKELGEAGLSLKEEEELLGEQRLLARAEDVLTAAASVADILNGDSDAADVGTLLGQASSLGGLQGVDEDLDAIGSSLIDMHYQVGELARELHTYADGVSVDPGRLEVVNERLRLYTELGRKYGGSTETAVRTFEEGRERLDFLEGGEEDVSRLEEIRAAETERALEFAAGLSSARRQAIPRLEEVVAGELAGLGCLTRR